MTREQVEKEMAQYRTIFTVVRLLEAAQVGSDKTLSDYCKCYDFWQKHTQCQNCISAQVLHGPHQAHQAGIHGQPGLSGHGGLP